MMLPSSPGAAHPPIDLAAAVRHGLADTAINVLIDSDDVAPRGLIVGPAGSGKTEILRQLVRRLRESGHTPTVAGPQSKIQQAPASQLVVVDDAHLLPPDRIQLLIDRAEDPDAGLVVAMRPWPHTDELRRLGQALERSRPAVLLGQLSRGEIMSSVGDAENPIPSSCIDRIIELSGAQCWLVLAALSAHDARDCALDPHHDMVGQHLQDRIAHRLRSVDPELRQVVEALSIVPSAEIVASGSSALDWENTIAHGYAEGLLQRNGLPPALVRQAVHTTTPVHRLAELASGVTEGVFHELIGDVGLGEWAAGIPGERIAAGLTAHADSLLSRDPRRARDLYEAAIASGANAKELACRRAHAEWALGNLDTAASHLELVLSDPHRADHDDVVDTSAAIWAARATMETAHAVYEWRPPLRSESVAWAAITGVGVGDPSWARADHDTGTQSPSMSVVALETLRRGLAVSLTDEIDRALTELVLGSEIYTSSHSTTPVPELPAVVAAVAAIHVGRLDVAASVLDSALRDGHGGAWARQRLLLWQSWVALQRERSHEARELLAAATSRGEPATARDRLLVNVLRVAMVRRDDKPADLVMAWQAPRDSLLRTRFDLYTFPLLAEVIVCAIRADDADLIESHFADALTIDKRLGTPHLWSAHIHWAGIQRAILLSRPDSLAPHAHALLAAATSNPLAARMAQAGRVWTAIMTGTIDPELIEEAAFGLGSVGLAWDGARMAAHGAHRTKDRRIASRLLACARELHPHEDADPSSAPQPPDAAEPSTNGGLSSREREVAVLMLQGKTYAEIGETIFISPRTAEHHIARIRRRLGATSRSDLITKLRVILQVPAANGNAEGHA